MKEPNPEQTASIFSLIVYTFLDPLVFEAYRVPHLSHERLPAIADYDHTEYLREKAFPVRTGDYSFLVDDTDCTFKLLDSFKGARGHLFFRLIRVFCTSLQVDHFQQPIYSNYSCGICLDEHCHHLQCFFKFRFSLSA